MTQAPRRYIVRDGADELPPPPETPEQFVEQMLIMQMQFYRRRKYALRNQRRMDRIELLLRQICERLGMPVPDDEPRGGEDEPDGGGDPAANGA